MAPPGPWPGIVDHGDALLATATGRRYRLASPTRRCASPSKPILCGSSTPVADRDRCEEAQRGDERFEPVAGEALEERLRHGGSERPQLPCAFSLSPRRTRARSSRLMPFHLGGCQG